MLCLIRVHFDVIIDIIHGTSPVFRWHQLRRVPLKMSQIGDWCSHIIKCRWLVSRWVPTAFCSLSVIRVLLLLFIRAILNKPFNLTIFNTFNFTVRFNWLFLIILTTFICVFRFTLFGWNCCISETTRFITIPYAMKLWIRYFLRTITLPCWLTPNHREASHKEVSEETFRGGAYLVPGAQEQSYWLWLKTVLRPSEDRQWGNRKVDQIG